MHYVVNISSSIEPITTTDTHITSSNLQPLATNTPSTTAENGISSDPKFNDTTVTITIHTLAGIAKFLNDSKLNTFFFRKSK